MEKKTLSVVNKVAAINKRLTYKEIIENHLAELDAERANLIPTSLVIVGEIADGNMYQVVVGESLSAVVGTLEVAKGYIILDSAIGEE